MSELGKNIRERRKFLELTQTDLAKALSWSVAYICDIERGHRLLNPSNKLAFTKLARVLGMPESMEVYRAIGARDRIDAYTKRELAKLGCVGCGGKSKDGDLCDSCEDGL